VVGADRSFWAATIFLVGTLLLVTFAIRTERPVASLDDELESLERRVLVEA
jgi:hypothetical protein